MPPMFAIFSRAAQAALVGILTLAAGALTDHAAGAEPARAWQAPASIRAAASAVALAQGASSVEAVAVDERLKLPACALPLDAQLHRAMQRGQGTVAVSCGGPEPWRLFVPVRVTDEVAVLVVQRNVQPGDVLTAADVAVRQQASLSLPLDYLSDPAQAVGLAVRRNQPAGAVLVPAALEQPLGVERGALVTLIAGGSDITVKVDGVALEPARLRQRVRVRSPSGRIVEGTVEAPGQVRVGL